MEQSLAVTSWRLAGLVALVCANGLFVAAEFSTVTVRKTRVDQLIAEGHRGARSVRRAVTAPDRYIAATQLGITMASLGLGWLAEPALAAVFEPALSFLPSHLAAATAHSIAVAIAFAIITAAELVERIAAGRHSRLPVYRADLDDVVGMLHVTDVLKPLASGTAAATAGTLAREVLTVPETLRADDLLTEMRRRRAREAVVIDEYGGTAGLVTFESLMERIVGEVPGETGAQARTKTRPDGSCEIDGLALVADINEQFGLHLDEETYTTVGGYVLGRLGRRARVNDTIEIEGRKMRVEALDGLRVAKVWLSKPS